MRARHLLLGLRNPGSGLEIDDPNAIRLDQQAVDGAGNDAAIFNGFYNESLASVPEPAGLAMADSGLAQLARRRRAMR
jgi:hypothetical protein